jgi:diaminohydroxyphosphoribosylaminopyrimidine deaminase/5-amino-6-(5-phosphoribosylamino)uracil reductase
VIVFVPNAAGKVDLALPASTLGERGINELHAEAGFKLNGSLLREGCVDELLLYLAPMLVGDAAHGLFNLPALTRLEDAPQGWTSATCASIGTCA